MAEKELMTNYKVLIPSAGTGSRLKLLSKHVNKALVTVGFKPVISHIIEKIPNEVQIVIPLGFKGDTVRNYIEFSHPDRRIIFKEIKNFDGEGSGLGHTMLECKDELQCPFIFCANDTLIKEEFPEPNVNWMGFDNNYDTTQYRSIELNNEGNVADILSKGASGDFVKPYIGLAGIFDFKLFWDSMNEGKDQGALQIGESYGLKFLIDNKIEAKKFTWYDTGNLNSLKRVREIFSSEDDPNILDKPDEAIWFVKDKVVKYSIDSQFILNRIRRANLIKDYVPNIIDKSDNMYSYQKVEGEVLSKNPTLYNFSKLLDWLNEFWEKKELSKDNLFDFHRSTMSFYKDKTYERVQKYFDRFEHIDCEENINGIFTPKLADILNDVDWDYLAKGEAYRFHGDLHFENILISTSDDKPFTLLDWRQDYGGILEYGDIYYDFAKLNHGFIICHELINNNLFKVNHEPGSINFEFLRKNNLVECEAYFKDYIEKNNFDYNKVEMLTSLIFLNIAALHHYPYSSLLFYLGKISLFNCLNSKP